MGRLADELGIVVVVIDGDELGRGSWHVLWVSTFGMHGARGWRIGGKGRSRAGTISGPEIALRLGKIAFCGSGTLWIRVHVEELHERFPGRRDISGSLV